MSEEQTTPALQIGRVMRLEPARLAGGDARWNANTRFPGDAEACGGPLIWGGRGADSDLGLAGAVDPRRQAQATNAPIDDAFEGARTTHWAGFTRVAGAAVREDR